MIKKINLILKGICILMLVSLSSCLEKGADNNTGPAKNNPPAVSLSAVELQVMPPIIKFTANASDSDGSVVKYEWDFDGNGVYDSATTGNSASLTYAVAGTYTAKVRVTDNVGATAEASTQVTVNPVAASNNPPAVSLSANPSAGTAPLIVNFTANASDSDGSVVKYEWDFDGNGVYDTTTSANIASYTYTFANNHNAKVKVTDDDEAIAESSISISVASPQLPAKIISFVLQGSPVANSVFLEQAATNSDTITLAVKIKGGTNVYGSAIEINFDSSKISYVSASEGNYLNQGGTLTTFLVGLSQGSSGVLLIGINRTGTVIGVNGDGVLCQIVLKASTVQTNTTVGFNAPNSRLISTTGSISGTSWLGGSLSYQ